MSTLYVCMKCGKAQDTHTHAHTHVVRKYKCEVVKRNEYINIDKRDVSHWFCVCVTNTFNFHHISD